MIIMLEGPDLAGKTTLAKQLQRKIKNSEIVHRGPPTGTVLQEYMSPLLEMRAKGGAYILDRWHWGEEIYGPILRGKSMFSDYTFRHVEQVCDDFGVTRVLLIPHMSVLEERYKERGDALLSFTQVCEAAGQYQRILLSKRHTVHRFYAEDPTKVQVAWLVAEAAHRAEECGWTV
jgi:hypothetical protein